MLFSNQTCEDTRARWTALLERVGPIRGRALAEGAAAAEGRVSADAVLAAQWICVNSPLSDVASYDFPLFLSCAEHGVFLRKRSPLAQDLPEDIFLNYVLHIRVNDEELQDCRQLFYSLAAGRMSGLDPIRTVIEANYWCAEQVTYQSTDVRTISALGAYQSGYGRCGEESTFAVNVLRALGIPARQVYTPRWSHCDDNHAWVEVWCGGQWHFLGACEPEEVLDRGWFTGAASRAMVIHSRCFGPVPVGEAVISRAGAVTFLSSLPRYAAVTTLTVSVRDTAGGPVEGAQVSFGILNGAEIFPAALVDTGEDGTASLTCGLGSLWVQARKGDICCRQLVYTPDTDRVELVLAPERPAGEMWQDYVFTAPRDRIVGVTPTPIQRELGAERTAAARRKREARVSALFDKARAETLLDRYGYSRTVYNLLRESRGNMGALADFLEDRAFDPEEKEALLLTLPAKDWRDVDPAVLREALAVSRPYAAGAGELYFPYIACPRVLHEPLRADRRFILSFFSPAEQMSFQEAPGRIWDYIRREISFDPQLEYSQLVTGAAGALAVKSASPLSQKILFVSICRTLGIPARLRPVDQTAEFWSQGRFLPVENAGDETGTLILRAKSGESWQYGADFTLGLVGAALAQTLDLSQARWEADQLTAEVRPGVYRLITDNRLPNGNIYASSLRFRLEAGETRTVGLRKHQADLEEMLADFTLEEFRVRDRAGRTVLGSKLTADRAVLLWLEEGGEPTEHILNEMLERQEDFRSLPAAIRFLVRSEEALVNAKLGQVLAAIPHIQVYFDTFIPNVEALARRMYVDPEKLPLILVAARPLHVVYASSGYNVGSGDMLIRICRSL